MKFTYCLSLSISLLFLILCTLESTQSSKILFLSFFTSKSHKITYLPLINKLAERGHEVTVLTTVSYTGSNSTHANHKEIIIFDMDEYVKNHFPSIFESKISGASLNLFAFAGIFKHFCTQVYSQKHVIDLLSSKFDLVIYEGFMNECASGYIHKLNTSTIRFYTMTTPEGDVRLLGGPSPTSFIPTLHSGYNGPMNFWQRTVNFGIDTMVTLMQNFYFIPVMEKVYRDALGAELPSHLEIIKNTSLTMAVSHFSLAGSRPYLPDVVEVGGLHMREAKPLPKDLEDFAESSAPHGFIFFSLGTVLRGSEMPVKYQKTFLGAFSKIKQKVLWKWETGVMDVPLPPNVKLIKWAPQQDLLAHKNIVGFITHGGLGGTSEAIFEGVPMIGIPMFGDQVINVETNVKREISLKLDFLTMSEEDIVDAINTIATDTKYRENAKKLSKIFRDQPIKPLEKAVFWVEYVLRHQGAVQLRSAGRDLNFIQFYSIDTISFIVSILLIVLYLAYLLIRGAIMITKIILFSNSSSNLKNSNKKKQ